MSMVSSPSSSFYYSCEGPLALVAEALLQRCAAPDTLRKTRQLHALVLVAVSPSSSPFLCNNLLSLYSKCGGLADARRVFDAMPRRTLVSYNAMIAAYSRAPPRHAPSAARLFREMGLVGLRPSPFTLSSLVRASASLRAPRAGSALHSRAVSSGLSSSLRVQTALLGMYSDCGSPEAAARVFDEMGARDAVAWNSIMASNVKNGRAERGLQLFRRMLMTGVDLVLPTNFTYAIALSACGRTGDRNRGRSVHAHMIRSESRPDLPLQNALLDMYSSCGDLATAMSVFERIQTPDLISWNSLIAGCSDAGDGEMAMEAFTRLVSRRGGPGPDEYTYAAVVSATASLSSLGYGKPLHAHVTKAGWEFSVFVGNALINMYFMNGEVGSARKLFDCIPDRDVVIWTEMVAGHSRLGEGELAIEYFYHMLEEGHKVDSFSLSSALNSSADLAALKQGEVIHSLAVKSGYEAHMSVSGSLVDMYAKNGDLAGARSAFSRVPRPDLKCWNSMIGGYGNHGDAEQAFKLFNEMVGQGLQPDHVTYVCLLSACSHCGLVERGRFYWFCMIGDGISPGIKHYTCMASLLSRAGLLKETEELITKSPFADRVPELWRILLNSCVSFKNLAMGVRAAEQVLALEPHDSSTHVLLSNLYASAGRWDAVAETRKKLRRLMLEKEQGLSWIEMKNVINVFSADDDCHLHVEDSRNELRSLQRNLKGWETSELQLLCGL